VSISKPLIRLIAFLLVAGFLAAMELTTLTGPHTGTTDSYRAIFGGADGVSGLRVGNPVRVSGVPVGKVTAVELVDAEHALVTFTANRHQAVTSQTWAVVRYANLLGQRYLALTQPVDSGGATLAPGATIPAGRTAPALSLTDLFNGFRPLFSALTPQQVNELSQDIIDVLQGQTARIDDLIASTASLSSNLADRDTTFATVIDSLSTLLTTVSKHDDQLAGVLTTLHALTAQLHEEGPAIVDSLDAVDRLIGSVGGLFDRLDAHSLPQDVADASSLTGVLAQNTGTVDSLLTGFASAFQTFSRTSQYGNWINVYACNIGVRTYGTVSISATQAVNGLTGLLGGPLAGLGGVATGILGGVALGRLASPLPLALPNGRVGGTTAHTQVCR
jgi:phospholipid/cholesterol/gamma-HCH transport system substrate-binding protein